MKSCFTTFLVVMSFVGFGQSRIDSIELQLEELSATQPALNSPVEVSLSEVSIQEFIRGIAVINELNVSVSESLNFNITNNFSNASVKSVFLFLCKEYDLDIEFTGSIMSFRKYTPPPPIVQPVVRPPIRIDYADATDQLSLNVKEDTLFEVAKKITETSLHNVVVAPEVRNLRVSGFIKNRPFSDALESFAFANGLQVRIEAPNFYFLEKLGTETKHPEFGKNTDQITEYSRPNVPGLQLTTIGEEITIRAENIPIDNVIMAVAYELGKHYYLFDVPNTPATLHIENASFDEFLGYVFSGTKFTFKNSEGVYLIGDRKQEGLRSTELILLENRTVESILQSIPQELVKDVEVQEFPDLNGIIVSGSYTRIDEIRSFLRQIDLPVPVVLIDLMIVEVNKDFNLEAGLRLGLGGENVPDVTSGSYNINGSGIEANMTSTALNALLASFSGPGFITLGALSPNFYASIHALESNGIIKKKSTPKLATMNGSEASLSLGETTFYAETNNSFIGAQNPALSQGIIYKPINADLSITIRPFVSGDEQITLTIEFTQSNFTNRISPQAPPGAQTKTFSSKVRVKNGETVLLGGLDESSTERSGEGLPFLARIPVIKWLFGVNKKTDSKSQINIFIKPTVIY